MKAFISFVCLTLVGGTLLWLATLALMAPVNISGPFDFSGYPLMLGVAVLGMSLIMLGVVIGKIERVNACALYAIAIGLFLQNIISYRSFPPEGIERPPEYEYLFPPDPINIVTSITILTLVALTAIIQTSRTSGCA